jgi:hypothetical protein
MIAAVDSASASIAAKWQGELAAWREAWSELADNPLLLYLDVTRRRAAARAPLWQRIAVTTILIGLALALAYVYYLDQSANQSWYMLSFDVVVITLMVAVCAVYTVWLFQGLFIMLSSGMRLLAAPGKRSVALQVDDMLSLTRLSDRDILLAGLRIILPAFLPRVLVGAILLWVLILLGASEAFQDLSGNEFWQALIVGPLTVAALFVGGALGSLCLLLLSICLGRSGQVHTASISSTILCAAFQSVWVPSMFGLSASCSPWLSYWQWSAWRKNRPGCAAASPPPGQCCCWLVERSMSRWE